MYESYSEGFVFKTKIRVFLALIIFQLLFAASSGRLVGKVDSNLLSVAWSRSEVLLKRSNFKKKETLFSI